MEIPEQKENAIGITKLHLYSGGAFGADTFFGLIALEYGITNNKQRHYRIDSEISKDLQAAGIETIYLDKYDINECYDAIDELFNKRHQRNKNNDLKARNYFQALDADGIFAIAELNEAKNGVLSGTNVAIQFGKQMKKPIYVYDYTVRIWYEYLYSCRKFMPYNKIPLLTEHFAGIGVRKCQKYDGCINYLGINVEKDIKQQIKNLFENYIKENL